MEIVSRERRSCYQVGCDEEGRQQPGAWDESHWVGSDELIEPWNGFLWFFSCVCLGSASRVLQRWPTSRNAEAREAGLSGEVTHSLHCPWYWAQ